MGTRPRVAVIGPCSVDTIVDLERLPSPTPHTVMARRWSTQIGGTSAGKALSLAGADAEVLLVTPEAEGQSGARLVRLLRRSGITVEAVEAHGPLERHLNLVAPPGSRVSIYLQPAGEITQEGLSRAHARLSERLPLLDAVFLDLASLSLALAPTVTAAGAPVWVDLHDYDGVEPFHSPFLAAADVVLMNGDRIGDAEAFLSAAVLEGRHAAVCTLGPDGAIGVAGDGTPVRVDAAHATVVDTNGAGDAFAAGMLVEAFTRGCLGRPMTAEELGGCMSAGARLAARTLASRGIAPGAPVWEE